MVVSWELDNGLSMRALEGLVNQAFATVIIIITALSCRLSRFIDTGLAKFIYWAIQLTKKKRNLPYIG